MNTVINQEITDKRNLENRCRERERKITELKKFEQLSINLQNNFAELQRDLGSQIMTLTTEKDRVQGDLQTTQREKNWFQSKLLGCLYKNSQKSREIRKLFNDLVIVRRKGTNLVREKNVLNTRINDLNTLIARTIQKLNINDRNDLNNLVQLSPGETLVTLLQKLTNLQNQITYKDSTIRTITSQRDQYLRERDACPNVSTYDWSKVNGEKTDYYNNLQRVRKDLDNVQNNLNNIQGQLNNANNSISSLNTQLSSARSERDRRPNISLYDWNNDYIDRPARSNYDLVMKSFDEACDEKNEWRKKYLDLLGEVLRRG